MAYKHNASVDLASKLWKSYSGKKSFKIEWDKLIAKYIIDQHTHGFGTDILDKLEDMETSKANLMDLAYLLEDDMEIEEMEELSALMGDGKFNESKKSTTGSLKEWKRNIKQRFFSIS